MTTREYQIGESFNLFAVIAKAEKLAARAQSKGLSGGYTITTETRRSGGGSQPVTQSTYVIIEGEPVKFNGWSFVAKVEYVNGQPVVTGSPWYEGPQVDRDTLRPNACDHCGISIARKYSIVVEDESGDRKQVGSSCVKDFLGAQVTGAWYSDKDPFDQLDSFRGPGVTLGSLSVTLAYAALVCRTSGFISKVKAAENYVDSTSDSVWLLLGRGSTTQIRDARDKYGSYEEQDTQTAQRALAFGRAIEGDSDYGQNVRAVFASDDDTYDPKYTGLVTSVVGVMIPSEAKAKEVAAPAVIEEPFAEPTTKIKLTDATVARVIPVESAYGSADIITLVAQGYRFKWFTSANPGLTEGDQVDFTATVKGTDIYQGQVSTTVLRLKVIAS